MSQSSSLPTATRAGPTTPDRDYSLGVALIVPRSISKVQSRLPCNMSEKRFETVSRKQAPGIGAFHEQEMGRSESLTHIDRQAGHHPDSALTGRCSSGHTGATHAAYPTLHCEPPARLLTRLLCVVEPSPLVACDRQSNVWSTALWPEATALLAL